MLNCQRIPRMNIGIYSYWFPTFDNRSLRDDHNTSCREIPRSWFSQLEISFLWWFSMIFHDFPACHVADCRAVMTICWFSSTLFQDVPSPVEEINLTFDMSLPIHPIHVGDVPNLCWNPNGPFIQLMLSHNFRHWNHPESTFQRFISM